MRKRKQVCIFYNFCVCFCLGLHSAEFRVDAWLFTQHLILVGFEEPNVVQGIYPMQDKYHPRCNMILCHKCFRYFLLFYFVCYDYFDLFLFQAILGTSQGSHLALNTSSSLLNPLLLGFTCDAMIKPLQLLSGCLLCIQLTCDIKDHIQASQ